ncbi:MAG: DUF3795 domain-containing protein [candidate division WOR-3 bacterium]
MNYQKEKAISYCGIYCLKCDYHSGKIKKSAEELLNILKEHWEIELGFRNKKGYDFNNFLKILEYLSKNCFCMFTCKQGSGWQNCPVRKCCEKKELEFCYECQEFPCQYYKKKPFKNKVKVLKEIKKMGIEKWVRKKWEIKND